MSSSPSDHNERRTRPRTNVALELKLHAEEHNLVLLSRTVDISCSGAFVRTSRALPDGAAVTVAFERGAQRNPLTLEAEVVRTGLADGGRSGGIALRFLDVTDLDEALINEIIERTRA